MFKISTGTRYGIRALLELSLHDMNKPLNLGDIAKNQNISVKYLESIFKLLKNNNIVKSTRGPGGGYQLVKNPEELDIYTIMKAIDGPLTTIDCVTDLGNCERVENCSTRIFWEELQDHIIGFLKSKTLKDIVEKAPGESCSWYATI